MQSKTMKMAGTDEVPVLMFPNLEETGIVRHGFSTRLGGVSSGDFASMNLDYNRGDSKELVLENFRRIGAAMGADMKDMVLSDQTHTTNIRRMTEEDRGKGLTKPLDYHDVDGMITDTPGLMLTALFADCVPLFFVDKVHKAIGLSHSGWRGTAGRMGEKTVRAMQDCFGSRPQDIIAAIGPSIGQECYEVGEDVAEHFQAMFSGERLSDVLLDKKNGKYQLDLWKANYYILTDAGLLPEHIAVTDLCTACHSGLLWSHRKSKGRHGELAAFLQLL